MGGESGAEIHFLLLLGTQAGRLSLFLPKM